MNKWYKEINLIGIKDWLWFVIYLRRNEFSPKLNMFYFYKNMERIIKHH
jgi:hypothetical protein